MNIQNLSAEIVRRIQHSQDSPQNCSEVVEQMIGDFIHLSGLNDEFRYGGSAKRDDGAIVIIFQPFKPTSTDSTKE